jgi:hypothetical protein
VPALNLCWRVFCCIDMCFVNDRAYVWPVILFLQARISKSLALERKEASSMTSPTLPASSEACLPLFSLPPSFPHSLTHSLTHSSYNVESVCVLIVLFLRSPSRAPCRTPSACAKRAAYPDPPPVVPDPKSIDAQAAYRFRQSAIAEVVSDPNCFQALGSSPGLLQSPML